VLIRIRNKRAMATVTIVRPAFGLPTIMDKLRCRSDVFRFP
jgi:hypothetical protein